MKSIEEARKWVAERIALIEKWTPVAEIAEGLRSQFLHQFSDITVSLSFGPHALHGVLLGVHQLTDMRELTGLRRAIRQAGFGAPTVDDYAAIRRRSWSYIHTETGVPLILSAFLTYGEGAKCEWVKTGTKEEDVFELRCPDGPRVDPTFDVEADRATA